MVKIYSKNIWYSNIDSKIPIIIYRFYESLAQIEASFLIRCFFDLFFMLLRVSHPPLIITFMSQIPEIQFFF